MVEKLIGKRVAVFVAFNLDGGIKKLDGVIATCSTLGGENFIVFEDGTMINIKYVQRIEIM